MCLFFKEFDIQPGRIRRLVDSVIASSTYGLKEHKSILMGSTRSLMDIVRNPSTCGLE